MLNGLPALALKMIKQKPSRYEQYTGNQGKKQLIIEQSFKLISCTKKSKYPWAGPEYHFRKPGNNAHNTEPLINFDIGPKPDQYAQ